MPVPRLGDVIVRSQAGSADAVFVVVEPATDRFLSGPFTSLLEAVNAAKRRLAPHGRVWHDEIDQRGRSLRPPILLPTSEPLGV